MKNFKRPRSRQSHANLSLSRRHRRILRGAGNRLFYYFTSLFLLPALLGSCHKEPGRDGPGVVPDPPATTVDSSFARICLQADGREVRDLHLFIYGADGIRGLDTLLRLDASSGWPDTLDVRIPTGPKIFAAIANSPRKFNLKALERYDAMEQLRFSFDEDNPGLPILGGSCEAPDQTGTVVLEPLLCRVVLASVSNTLEDFELLENPRVRLRDLPDGAEILRLKDFRPTELLDAGPWTALPCDVGFFPQKPGIILWCYPNDTPESVLGVPRPSLEFACEIKGKNRSFSVPLPPLPRASRVEVDLTVGGPDEHSYKFRQE